jgi:dCMP deaminase
MKDNRPTWDEYFMTIVDAVSRRSTCDRGFSACVIVRDKHILSTGYSGSPSGTKHCSEAGHELHEVHNLDRTSSKHCIRTVHAEQNAICQAAKQGISIDGATAYVNMEPCYTCAKMLINAGIVRVVAGKRYHQGNRTREIFEEAGVELVILDDSDMEYENQI